MRTGFTGPAGAIGVSALAFLHMNTATEFHWPGLACQNNPIGFLCSRTTALGDRLTAPGVFRALSYSKVQLIPMLPNVPTQTSSKPGNCLILYRLPARLDAAQTATLLGFQSHDISVLVSSGLLKPLGRPASNSIRYFASVDIDLLREDRDWLDKATRTISRHWQEKNGSRRANPQTPRANELA